MCLKDSRSNHNRNLFSGIICVLVILIGFSGCSDIPQSVDSKNSDAPQNSTTSFTDAGMASYDIIGLGTLGGDRSFAWDVNESGQVVGYSETSTGYFHAFLWSKSDGMQDLGTLGGDVSLARGINDIGEVTGESRLASGAENVFLWDKTNGMQDIGNFGGISVFALEINDHSEIVGQSSEDSDNQYAFVWSDEDGMIQLEGNGIYDIAWDINSNGIIVGGSSPDGFPNLDAVSWNTSYEINHLPTFGGTSSQAQAINDKGEIAGYSQYSNGEHHAFLIDENGILKDLGTLGGTYSDAIGINENSQVVGTSSDSEGDSYGFIWDDVNGMQKLPTLSGQCLALSINDQEQIVGYCKDNNDNFKAVLWNPLNNTDTTPPELTYTTEKTTLWPPNHKMHVVVSDIQATDIVDENPQIDIQVTSNEHENGTGDGNSKPDWQIEQQPDGTYNLLVRAERKGNGNDRIYSIDISATDASDNTTSETVTVTVGHDKS